MSGFLTKLRVEEIAPGTWRLLDELAYASASGLLVEVPAGFETDFASVPRLPLAYLLAGGIGDRAAVIHDYFYRTTPHTVTRAEADAIFHEALIAADVAPWRAYLMWLAVRLGGASSWVPEKDHGTEGAK